MFTDIYLLFSRLMIFKEKEWPEILNGIMRKCFSDEILNIIQHWWDFNLLMQYNEKCFRDGRKYSNINASLVSIHSHFYLKRCGWAWLKGCVVKAKKSQRRVWMAWKDFGLELEFTSALFVLNHLASMGWEFHSIITEHSLRMGVWIVERKLDHIWPGKISREVCNYLNVDCGYLSVIHLEMGRYAKLFRTESRSYWPPPRLM